MEREIRILNGNGYSLTVLLALKRRIINGSFHSPACSETQKIATEVLRMVVATTFEFMIGRRVRTPWEIGGDLSGRSPSIFSDPGEHFERIWIRRKPHFL